MSVTIHVKIMRHTEKAVMVEHDGEPIWLPKSQIESVIPLVNVDCDMDISDWIADQKNLTASAVERYAVEQLAITSSTPTWAVKDMNANPIHVMCTCGNARDANIIAASLEMTKNKL
jgi:hypothetical protein